LSEDSDSTPMKLVDISTGEQGLSFELGRKGSNG
jgi:hypothetical protein